jgi:hypothetical protein
MAWLKKGLMEPVRATPTDSGANRARMAMTERTEETARRVVQEDMEQGISFATSQTGLRAFINSLLAGIAAAKAGMGDEGAMAETLSKEGREAGEPIAVLPLKGLGVTAGRAEEEAGGEAVEMVRMADRGATARIYQLRTLPASIQAILMRALMEAIQAA